MDQRVTHGKIKVKSSIKSKCKDPEAEKGSACYRSFKEVSVATAARVRGCLEKYTGSWFI